MWASTMVRRGTQREACRGKSEEGLTLIFTVTARETHRASSTPDEKEWHKRKALSRTGGVCPFNCQPTCAVVCACYRPEEEVGLLLLPHADT